MKIATPRQRVIIEAAIDGSLIRGTLIAPSGYRRDFHGWLELNTALEATLDTRADRAPSDNPAASPGGPSQRSRYAAHPPVTKSVNPPARRFGTQARPAGAVRRRTNAKLP